MSVFSTSSDQTAPGTNKQTVYKCPKCGWEIKSHGDLSGKPCLNCDGKVERVPLAQAFAEALTKWAK